MVVMNDTVFKGTHNS